MVFAGSVQVPLPLFVAARLVWPPTSTRMVAAGVLTVPPSAGLLLLVARAFTATVGTEPLITSSFVVASVATLPRLSVAVTATL